MYALLSTALNAATTLLLEGARPSVKFAFEELIEYERTRSPCPIDPNHPSFGLCIGLVWNILRPRSLTGFTANECTLCLTSVYYRLEATSLALQI